jgi:hypothetical protein
MFKKIKYPVLTLIAAAAMITGMSSFVDDGDGDAGACTQCVVKDGNTVIFSCKTTANESCSKNGTVNGHTVNVSCNNAKAC